MKAVSSSKRARSNNRSRFKLNSEAREKSRAFLYPPFAPILGFFLIIDAILILAPSLILSLSKDGAGAVLESSPFDRLRMRVWGPHRVWSILLFTRT